MKIEHLALNVEDPVAMARWYTKNLGFTILQETSVSPFAHFIADSSKDMVLEIFNLPDKQVPDYRLLDPAIMHLGFEVEDIEADYQRLVAAGSTVVEEVNILKNGNKAAMLRDPWGLPIQLIKRKALIQ